MGLRPPFVQEEVRRGRLADGGGGGEGYNKWGKGQEVGGVLRQAVQEDQTSALPDGHFLSPLCTLQSGMGDFVTCGSLLAELNWALF